MRVRVFFAAGAAAIIMAGCSIHPLPEDFSRSATFDIVEKIRCEARDAIADVALTPKGKVSYASFHRDPAHPLSVETARAWLSPALQHTAIGYSFRFTITDGDNGSGSALFQLPSLTPAGSFTVGVSAGEDKKRKSDRSFDLAEDFAQLLADGTLICSPNGRNWIYPITGEIGLREVIETYVRLSGLKIFTPPSSSGGGGSGGGSSGGGGSGSGGGSKSRDVNEFTDDLTFTTTLNASVSPNLILKPVSHDFRLASASGVFGGSRQDVHDVTIALKTPPAPGAGGARAFALQGSDAKSSILDTLQSRRNLKILSDQILEGQ